MARAARARARANGRIDLVAAEVAHRAHLAAGDRLGYGWGERLGDQVRVRAIVPSPPSKQ